MAIPIAPIMGAASSANQDDGGQKGPASGGKGMGFKGIVTGAIDMRHAREEEKRAREQQRKQDDLNAFNYDRATDRADLGEDIAMENYGELASDYISPEMLTGPGAERFGGALETMIMASHGYNPAMAHNPFINQYSATREAADALGRDARAAAEKGVSSWESALDSVGSEYDAGRTALRSDVDDRAETFATTFADDRAERREDEASLMIEQMISEGQTSTTRRQIGATVERMRAEGKTESEILEHYANLGLVDSEMLGYRE